MQKYIRLVVIAMLAASVSGCFWPGPYRGDDRGGHYDRRDNGQHYDQRDNGQRYDRGDDNRHYDQGR